MGLVDRLVAAIRDTNEPRDTLLLVGSPAAVTELRDTPGCRSLWLELALRPHKHPAIVGYFADVPVAERQLPDLAERAFLLVRQSNVGDVHVIAGW